MIYYTKFLCKNNNADWITFVHGAGGSSSIWFRQIKEFKRFFNVILLDLRGHGRSKYHIKNVFEKKYTFKSISNDIVEVLNKENIKSSHFIGISLGTILIRQLEAFFHASLIPSRAVFIESTSLDSCAFLSMSMNTIIVIR